MGDGLEAAIARTWVESLQYAYGFARGKRAAEIHGRHISFMDARGLNPESVAWGAIQACESLIPELAAEGVACTPKALRDAAREDAWSEHIQNVTGAAA